MQLHLMENSSISKDYINFVNSNFVSKEHKFKIFVFSEKSRIELNYNNVEEIIDKDLCAHICNLIVDMNLCDKIHVHGMFNPLMKVLIFLQPWLLKKVNWIIWSADLYFYNDMLLLNKKLKVRQKIHCFIDSFIKKNVAYVSTLVKEDYDLAKKLYNVRGRKLNAIYTMNILNRLNSAELSNIDKKEIYIQVGHCSTYRNKHLEIFELLYKYRNENIRIFCPLSYGDESYKKKVIREGQSLFGSKFVPIVDFMKYSDYLTYLNSIDIAIFANNRQHALGNIYNLLYFGKKIFIRSDTSMWNHFIKDLNIDVYDLGTIVDLSFDEFTNYDKCLVDNNRKNIINILDDNHCYNMWVKIFEI